MSSNRIDKLNRAVQQDVTKELYQAEKELTEFIDELFLEKDFVLVKEEDMAKWFSKLDKFVRDGLRRYEKSIRGLIYTKFDDYAKESKELDK